jgi:hypothetical protein
MSLFTTNIAAITRPGVYLAVNKAPAIVAAQGAGYAALVCQTPFGPPLLDYTPTSDGDRNLTYAPPGFNRDATGILAMIEKGWNNLLKVVRVLGGTAYVTATVILSSSVPAQLITVTAKYAGVDANSLTATVAAASDGNANHFNLTIAISGASGTTSETYTNLNVSGTGAVYLGQSSQILASRLIASITQVGTNTGVPVAGSTSFTSGTNGTSIVSGDYVGVAGTANAGIALLEGDNTIRQFCTDDCGSSLRAAVNGGATAHALLMGDRIAFINGNSGLSSSASITDAANYQGPGVCYVDPWANELDDVSGAVQLVTPAPFLMSLAVQLPPSIRLAWRDPSVLNMLNGIYSLQAARGQQAANNTFGGVTTLEVNPTGAGGFCVELDVTTETPLDNTQMDLPRQRMGIYIGTAVIASFPSYVNGPNVPLTQSQIVTAFTAFMDTLVANAAENPFALPYVLAYQIGNISGENTPTQTALGNFIIPVAIQTDTGMQHLIFNVQYGPTVQISLVGSQTASGG